MKRLYTMLLGIAFLIIGAGLMATAVGQGKDLLTIIGLLFFSPIGLIITLYGFFRKDE